MKIAFIIFFLIEFYISSAQTIGGSSAYNFLNLPANALLTAEGGVNISAKTDEVSITSANPALLDASLNKQINLSFNNFIAGIKTYSVTSALYSKKLNATFGGHIYFVDYGNIQQTDAAGNINGTFRPVDYVVQASAARQYLQNFSYGAAIKFIHSGYQLYQSSAIAFDFGVLYQDSLSNLTASIVAKNMGFQLKTYAGIAEDLPFDFEIGITKRLLKAPFGFSITAQHVHQFNILYNDAAFNIDNNFSQSTGFISRLFNHFILAAHIYVDTHLELILGYNELRRTELNIGSGGNGLNGFSGGIRIKFNKIQIQYARSSYQSNVSYNQLGISLYMYKKM